MIDQLTDQRPNSKTNIFKNQHLEPTSNAENKPWQRPTFTWKTPTLSSALSGFTSEFDMVSGGSHLLFSLGRIFTIN